MYRNTEHALRLFSRTKRVRLKIIDTAPAPGTNGPLIPGDPEREAEAIRSKEGIPLLKPVVDDLIDISKKTGVPFEIK